LTIQKKKNTVNFLAGLWKAAPPSTSVSIPALAF